MKQLHGGTIDAESNDVNAYIELRIMHNIRKLVSFILPKPVISEDFLFQTSEKCPETH